MNDSKLARALAEDLKKLSDEDLRLVAVVIYEFLRTQEQGEE